MWTIKANVRVTAIPHAVYLRKPVYRRLIPVQNPNLNHAPVLRFSLCSVAITTIWFVSWSAYPALTIDGFRNLWIGDDPSDGGLNFTGRLWRIPASRVASIP